MQKILADNCKHQTALDHRHPGLEVLLVLHESHLFGAYPQHVQEAVKQRLGWRRSQEIQELHHQYR